MYKNYLRILSKKKLLIKKLAFIKYFFVFLKYRHLKKKAQ